MREAAVMLIIKDGKILGVSRRYNKNKFGLAGGKVEPNETPEQAAIRETFEETGVTVNKCTLIFRRDEMRDKPEGNDYHTYCFYADEWFGDPFSSEEGAVEWLTEEEITGTKAAFADYNTNTFLVFKKLYPNIL